VTPPPDGWAKVDVIRGMVITLRMALRMAHEAGSTRTARRVRMALESSLGALHHARKRARAAGATPTVPDSHYRTAAIDHYVNPGEIEIDDTALISRSDTGAYVQAWVWVPNDEGTQGDDG
jgi:hypothetical protein